MACVHPVDMLQWAVTSPSASPGEIREVRLRCGACGWAARFRRVLAEVA